MKTVGKKITGFILAVSMLVYLFAGFGTAAPANRDLKTWTGWIIDRNCLGVNPVNHSKMCNLMGGCYASGLGLYLYEEGASATKSDLDHYLLFDAESKLLAKSFLEKLPEDWKKNITLKVTGYAVDQIPSNADESNVPETDSDKIAKYLKGIHIISIEAASIEEISTNTLPSPNLALKGAVSVPGTPKGIKAEAKDKQAVIAFTAPESNGGSQITGYKVETYSDGVLQPISASGPASPITVTGLTNGKTYVFKVKATNTAGDSEAPEPSAAVTPKSAVSSALSKKDNTEWTIAITGAKAKSVAFTNIDYLKLKGVTVKTTGKCENSGCKNQNMTVTGTWTGVTLKSVLDYLGVKNYKSVTVVSKGGRSQNYLPSKVNFKGAVLAVKLNGKSLDSSAGPVELVIPGQSESLWIKNTTKIVINK